jgi:hypothetical protein
MIISFLLTRKTYEETIIQANIAEDTNDTFFNEDKKMKLHDLASWKKK